MHGFKRHLTIAVALACGVTALTGSALAAPPSEPPGQAKKEEAPAPAATPSPPGQEKKAEKAEPAPAAKPSPAPAKAGKPAKADKPAKGINATTAGVKPSNDTAKNTSCKTGGGQGASATCQPGPKPDMSKRYGNAKTAAQIANSRGAPADTEIFGPGNSQPHKVCKNGHWVDVHAVKSYSDNTCAAQKSPTALSTGTSAPTAMATSVSSVSSVSSSSSPSSLSSSTASSTPAAGTSPAPAASSAAPAGGVLGAQHTSDAGSKGGVAGAFAEIGGLAAGSLPFTGLPLWGAVLIGLAALALGWTIWRRTRPAATTGTV